MQHSSQEQQTVKIAIVAMVRDGEDYLPEFLTHHLSLVNDIFLIDHSSSRDLRELDLDRVHVFRSNHRAQYQSECTNIVIVHRGIRQNYDWLFVLDIDEFLPLFSKDEIERYLFLHRDKKAILFHWLNGVPFDDLEDPDASGLTYRDDIRFFNKPSHNYKTFVNIKATKGMFWIPTGSHHIGRRQSKLQVAMSMFTNKQNFTPYVEKQLTLFHILATSKTHFVQKIANYVDQFQYRKHVTGQGGWHVENYSKNPTDEQFLWYVANFRISNPDKFFDAKKQNFRKLDIFKGLDRDELVELRAKIDGIRIGPICAPPPLEDEYRTQKIDDNAIHDNLQWFAVNNACEIINKHP